MFSEEIKENAIIEFPIEHDGFTYVASLSTESEVIVRKEGNFLRRRGILYDSLTNGVIGSVFESTRKGRINLTIVANNKVPQINSVIGYNLVLKLLDEIPSPYAKRFANVRFVPYNDIRKHKES